MYNDGHMIKQEWLDRLTLRELQSVVQHEKKSSNYFYMRIEFPEVKCEDRRYHVLYFEEVSSCWKYYIYRILFSYVFDNRMLGSSLTWGLRMIFSF